MGKESLIIKIGSDTLVRDGIFDKAYANDVASQICDVRESGLSVILVSSGGIAIGKNLLGEMAKRSDIAKEGQKVMYRGWKTSFADSGLPAREIVVVESQLKSVHQQITQSLHEGHIPVINGDDTANSNKSVREISIIQNNDNLAKWLAILLHANLLLLTNVNGVYNKKREVKSVIARQDEIYLFDTLSVNGTGGMKTKLEAGFAVANQGKRACVANGRRPNVIRDFVCGNPVGTLLISA